MQVERQTRDVVDQAQIRSRETLPDGGRALAQFSKRWDACELPVLDFPVNLRRSHKIGTRLALGRLFAHSLDVHVVASAVVFCAVFATMTVSARVLSRDHSEQIYHCGNVSSHRICRLLQVRQPLRDLVWLLRGGPPPGPAMVLLFLASFLVFIGMSGGDIELSPSGGLI